LTEVVSLVPITVGVLTMPALAQDWSAGLRIVDVSSPSAPAHAGSIATLDDPLGIAVAGGCEYVARLAGSFEMADVSAHSTPIRVGEM
jgi:hypothetical protein